MKRKFTFYYQTFEKKGGKMTSHGVGERFTSAIDAAKGLVRLNTFTAKLGQYSKGIIGDADEMGELFIKARTK